jgi:hypothetical protein
MDNLMKQLKGKGAFALLKILLCKTYKHGNLKNKTNRERQEFLPQQAL